MRKFYNELCGLEIRSNDFLIRIVCFLRPESPPAGRGKDRIFQPNGNALG
jgi:hypothetical protein